MSEPAIPITSVLDAGIDAVLGGSFGYLRIPAGGYLNVTWLSKKECYRLTIDVTAGHPLSEEASASFNAETLRRLKELAA
jgi:hypothetical protein